MDELWEMKLCLVWGAMAEELSFKVFFCGLEGCLNFWEILRRKEGRWII